LNALSLGGGRPGVGGKEARHGTVCDVHDMRQGGGNMMSPQERQELWEWWKKFTAAPPDERRSMLAERQRHEYRELREAERQEALCRIRRSPAIERTAER
jgi:hypothetical protein